MKGHRRLPWSTVLAVVVAVLGLTTVAGASASGGTTIGQTSPFANYACEAEFDLQTGVDAGTSFVVPSGSWLLDSWSTYSGNAGGAMGLMIFRPTAVPNTYTVVAESPVETLRFNSLNTFPSNFAVRGGDLLGFWSGGGAACATYTGLPADLNPYGFGSEPPVGANVTMEIAPGYRLNISATLRSPADLLADLLVDVTGPGPGTSLADKVELAQRYVAANQTPDACAVLDDFVSQVAAQSGKKLSVEDAASFASQANNVKAALGC